MSKNIPPGLEGFFPKSRFKKQRHPRTLSSDISEALSRKDHDLLQYAKLYLKKNGEIIPGDDSSLNNKRIVTLRKEGSNPMWYLHPEFLELVKQRGNNDFQVSEDVDYESEPGPSKNRSNNNTDTTDLPENPEIRGIVAEYLYQQEKEHSKKLEAVNTQLLKVVEDSNQLTAQNNALMARFQEMGLLTSGQSEEQGSNSTNNSTSKAVDAEVISTKPVTKSTSKPKPRSSTSKKKSTKKSSTKKTSQPKKKQGWLRSLFG